MTLAVEENVPLDPVDVRLLGPPAVVAGADRVTDPVEEAWARRADRAYLTEVRGGASRAILQRNVRLHRCAIISRGIETGQVCRKEYVDSGQHMSQSP